MKICILAPTSCQHPPTRHRRLWLAAVALLAQSPHALRATDYYWDPNGVGTAGAAVGGGNTATGNWDGTTANFNSDADGLNGGTTTAAPTLDDDVFFSAGTDATGTFNITVTGARTANRLTFQEGAVTLNGAGTLTLGGSATDPNPAGISVNSTVAGPTTISTILAGANNFNVSNVSAFALVLAGTNTFTGNLTLTQGILRTGNSGSTNQSLGTGAATLTLQGGELQLFRPGQTAGSSFGRNTTVTGDVQITSGENSAATGVTHTLGTLAIGAQTLTVAPSAGITVSSTAGITFGATTVTGANTSAGGTTFNVSNGNAATTRLTLGALDGAGAFNKTGAGELYLATAAAATFTGDSYLRAGTLSQVSNTALGTGTLTLGDTAGNAAATLSEVAAGGARAVANNIVVAGGSTGLKTILNSSSASNSSVTLSGTITLNDNLTINTATGATGVLTLTGASITASGNGFTITNVGAKTLAITTTGIGAGVSLLQNNGASSLTLSGANPNFTGTLDVEAGTGSIGGGATSVEVLRINSGATVTFNHSSQSLAGITDGASGGGTFYDSTSGSARTITLNGSGTYSFSGTLGTTTVTGLVIAKTGTGIQTFAGNNVYTSGTTVSGGTLLANGVGDGSTSSATGTGAVTVSGGTLGGTGKVLGAVTVNTASSINAGNVGPAGSAAAVGMLTTGALTLTAGATAAFDIAAVSQFDQLISTAAVKLGTNVANLNITVAPGLTFTGSEVFPLLSGTSLTGTFLGVAQGQTVAFGGYSFVANYTTAGFSLTAMSNVPEPGAWIFLAGSAGLVLACRKRPKVARATRNGR